MVDSQSLGCHYGHIHNDIYIVEVLCSQENLSQIFLKYERGYLPGDLWPVITSQSDLLHRIVVRAKEGKE